MNVIEVGTRVGLLEVLELGSAKVRCKCHGCDRVIFRSRLSLQSSIRAKARAACKRCRTRNPMRGRLGSTP